MVAKESKSNELKLIKKNRHFPGHKEIVELLIANGAIVDAMSNYNTTALMLAAADGKGKHQIINDYQLIEFSIHFFFQDITKL